MDSTMARLEALKLWSGTNGSLPYSARQWREVKELAGFLSSGCTPDREPSVPATDLHTDAGETRYNN